MKYYAYRGADELGSEALGTDNKILFELKTDAGARRRARLMLGPAYRLYRYTNFYDDNTFSEVRGGGSV
jgi:hypothetical protein